MIKSYTTPKIKFQYLKKMRQLLYKMGIQVDTYDHIKSFIDGYSKDNSVLLKSKSIKIAEVGKVTPSKLILRSNAKIRWYDNRRRLVIKKSPTNETFQMKKLKLNFLHRFPGLVDKKKSIENVSYHVNKSKY